MNQNEPAREAIPDPNPLLDANTTQTLFKISAFGTREASMELYDACLRIVEVANLIEERAAVKAAMGADLTLRVITARLAAEQALDRARRLS